MKILIIGAKSRSLINFRGDLIRKFVRSGHCVTAMASSAPPEIKSQILEMGVDFHSYPVQRNGFNPWRDLHTFVSLYKFFRKNNPDIILAYTIKPVIWGGIASIFVRRTQFFGMITGLGFAFEGQGFMRKCLQAVVIRLYHLAVLKATRVIFQNPDNRDTFVNLNIIPAKKCVVVNGSGVNVKHFKQMSFSPGPPVFLLIARLLGEKGIRKYVLAAKKIKKIYPDAVFNLLGGHDPSPDGIPLPEVQGWHSEGAIQYLGVTNDVRPYLAQCHVYVLPSYHEGMPRTVLEAMAVGRPILTTNATGCRETVVPGENGYLVPVRDVDALAERMMWFIEHREEWERMGKKSREMAEKKFDVQRVNRDLMEIMDL